jgi:hypothetical protein
MSSSKSTNFIKGSAFCNSRKLSWVGLDKCKVLAENICKHFEEIKEVRQQKKVRDAETKAKSWSGIAAKSVPAEVAAKIAEEDRILKEQSETKRAAEQAKQTEEAAKLAAEKKERWERNYVRRMSEQYGLKKDFVMQSNYYSQSDIRLSKGDLWYFKVERTPEDHKIAKKLREDITNRKHFRAYLKEKYFSNWLYKSQDTEDDCTYLDDLRYEEETAIEEAEWEQEEREREWSRQLQEEQEMKEKEKEEIKAKLASGKISRKQFHDWEIAKLEEEWESQGDYHDEGLRIWERVETSQKEFKKTEAEWKARNESREK